MTTLLSWARVGAVSVLLFGMTSTAWGTPAEPAPENHWVKRWSGSLTTVWQGSATTWPIDEAHYEIWADPGSPISGTFTVQTNNALVPNAVAPLGWTVDLGVRELQPRLVNGWIGTGIGYHDINISGSGLNAPVTGDMFHLTVAFTGEFTIGQVMSGTNWSWGPDVWYDGNDVGFDWTEDQFDSAILDGIVPYDLLLPPDGYTNRWLPATAIVVHTTPEPATAVLLALGGLALIRRRR